MSEDMRLNDEELELVSMARGQNIDEMVAVVERIVAARVAEALAPIKALADEWSAVPDYRATVYDEGRVDQRHMAIEELLAALPAPEPTP